MLVNLIKICKSVILFIFFNFVLYVNVTYADIINDFKISGNDRISNETIILFSGYKLKDDINNDDLNELLKNLYKTTFFKNVNIEFENNTLFIDVVENPLVQTIIFEGIKNDTLKENIKEILFLREKSSFAENKVKDDQNRIINTLRMSGYYFAQISTNVKKNDNNTVDIIYSVELGDKALIKNIKFIGNKIFKDNKLRKVIVSEEAKFWKFLSSKKYIDVQRFNLDADLLTNFYKNNGYYNAKVNSSFAQIIKDEYFEIVFNIDAGKKYFFNDLDLNIPIEYNKNDFSNLNETLINLKEKSYSLNKIEDILDDIDLIALDKDYEFVSATYNEKIVDGNKINLTINLKDSEKFYIQKINIYGNTITSERVIRNQLLADEGDPYNELLVNKSQNNIRALNIFKTVDLETDTNKNEMLKTIDIKVEEKPTGEIFAGAGTGTNGSSISFGLNENNYNGEGIKLGTDFSLSEESFTGSLFINEPNYKNSNRSFNRSVERIEDDKLSSFGYKTEKTGFTIGTSYEQYDDIFFSPKLNNYYEKITTNSKASAAKRKQDGDYFDFLVDYRITLNKLNQNFNPTDGFKFTFSQELPLVTEDYSLINKLNYSKYYQTSNGTILSFDIFTAAANSLSDDDVRVTKRIFIPSKKLRGFEPGKIGPKDGSDYIGGNYASSFNVASTLPDLFADVQNLDVSIFYDAANVWGVDYDSSIDENSKIRSSTGLAIDWFTPIGPLSLSYSFPITKASTDTTETIRFNIGTTF